jgi:excisionase family DNA binding protein
VTASEEQFLSLEDVAARLQVSDQTVRRWIKSGKLTAYKPGLEYRIRETALEEFLRAYQVGEAEAYFVPLEEGEEEDKVEIRFYYYQVLEGDEPILKAMRKASPEEAATIREELERFRG